MSHITYHNHISHITCHNHISHVTITHHMSQPHVTYYTSIIRCYTYENEKMMSTYLGLNPRPSASKSNALPLSYITLTICAQMCYLYNQATSGPVSTWMGDSLEIYVFHNLNMLIFKTVHLLLFNIFLLCSLTKNQFIT